MNETFDHEREIERLKAEVERKDQALRVASANLADLNDRLTKLIATLNSALTLTDVMMTELRKFPEPPPLPMIIAKSNFDNAMKKLLGNENVSQTRGDKT